MCFRHCRGVFQNKVKCSLFLEKVYTYRTHTEIEVFQTVGFCF